MKNILVLTIFTALFIAFYRELGNHSETETE
jgi:hypothetical protein